MKFALVGPESVGKTTIGRFLGERYGGLFVEEYAREYVEHLSRPYTYGDVVAIARYQIAQLSKDYETEYVFFDTDLIITQVWFEERFGSCPQFVIEGIQQHFVDAYLLLSPDIPFQADPVRENPHRREELFTRYLELVRQTGLPYGVVTGDGQDRIENACYLINKNMRYE